MKKIIVFVAFSSLVTLFISSCGSTKHAGKCDAYGSVIKTTGDLAKK